MKRFITIFLFFIFFLTGCQNKNLSTCNEQQETSLTGISDTFNEVSTSQYIAEEYTGTMQESTNLSEISSSQENVHITEVQDLFVVPGNGLTEDYFDRKDFGKGNKFEINYFSVGNADAALVECEGHYMMIDCGTKKNGNRDSYVIDRFLQEKNVTEFDYIVCTHPHDDHYNVFLDILKGDSKPRKYDRFLCSTKADKNTSVEFNKFCKSVKEYSSHKFLNGITVPKVGKKYELGSAEFEILAVNTDGKGIENDSSIVLMVTFKNYKFLFMGDAEFETEKALSSMDIKCDVLKVAHHGSHSSTTDSFLSKALPKYAVISVGNENQYDHPSSVVIDRLENRNVKILRTDNGIVTCTSDGKKMDIGYRK